MKYSLDDHAGNSMARVTISDGSRLIASYLLAEVDAPFLLQQHPQGLCYPKESDRAGDNVEPMSKLLSDDYCLASVQGMSYTVPCMLSHHMSIDYSDPDSFPLRKDFRH